MMLLRSRQIIGAVYRRGISVNSRDTFCYPCTFIEKTRLHDSAGTVFHPQTQHQQS